MRDYLIQVRRELGKITWPTRRETVATTIMVFVMVIVMSLFFLAVDEVASGLIKMLLG